jgi:hypothetical protein
MHEPNVIATDCCIQEFLNIKKVDYPHFPARYINMARTLGIESNDLAKHVPSSIYSSWKESLTSQCLSNLKNEQDGSYLETLARIKKVISELKPAVVDERYLDSFQEPLKSRVQSLKPLQGNFHSAIKYSNSGSVTGRLTIVSGPNVLTMPAEYKKTLRSRFKGGKIAQVDLVAAEPTIALNVMKKHPKADPYLELAEGVFNSLLDRNACKHAVLCALYGQSKKKLSTVLGPRIDANEAIRSTKSYFDYVNLLSFIRSGIDDDNVMRNFFGRPIRLPDSSDSLVVSYYLQSTAAEAAILAFGDLVKRTREHCVPLHIIHDALLLDCKPDYYRFLMDKKIIKLKLNDWILPAKITPIDE